MSSILDIIGTVQKSFMINNRCSVRAGDELPSNIVGKNGDLYLRTTGQLYWKSNNAWQEMQSEDPILPPFATNERKVLRVNANANGIEYWDESLFYTRSNNDETISGTWTFSQPINGTAVNALWGDLAEVYETDAIYPKGTLVCFGGEKEISIALDKVNAVITSEPGFILNSQMENGQAIALVGRVPVRVIGRVHKFDDLMLSDIPGVATCNNGNATVIAKALEDKTTAGEGLVLCVTQLSL